MAMITSTNSHESAVALAKLQKLLLEHNLTLSQLQEKKQISHIKGSVTMNSNRKWRRELVDILARFHFCGACAYRGRNEVGIVGERENIELVIWLVKFVEGQLENLAATAYMKARTALPGVIWKESFYLGAIQTIRERLEA